ncbi:tetratricopeptide repeat protein [Parasediminibacterium paludis]|uniref:Tetratricopeptide repeat protein n=1 Tax=Parasediminibacterium paludis TaxID=908966 RepID=A0ABV8PXG7_9BACT
MSEQIVDAQLIETNEVLSKAKSFWDKNGNYITLFLVGLIIVVGGFLGYKQFIIKPKEEKAADAIYKAQQYFQQDSARLVLEGDGTNKGVLYIINNYGGTKAANLAHYYAGVSYLKLGEFNKAIEHLKDFKTDAKQIQAAAYGVLGDAYAEVGKNDDAIDSYKKAGSTFEFDEALSSEYLFRAALLSATLKKDKEALDLFKSLKEKFPKTEKAQQADKYINKISVEKADLSVN